MSRLSVAKCHTISILIFLLVLSISSHSSSSPRSIEAYAESQISARTVTSNSFQLTFVNPDGTSEYTIVYSYPDIIQFNTNFTVQVTIFVTMLRGLKLYLVDYGLTLSVFDSQGGGVIKQIIGTPGSYLYEGSHWGPLNVSIPINSSDVQMEPGNTIHANISLQFIGDVWYDRPINWHYYDSGTRSIGNISIIQTRNSTSGSYSILILATIVVSAAGIIAVTSAVLILRRKRNNSNDAGLEL
jgi:hypothetical protein